MAQMGRPGLTAAQKRELWSRWQAGESLSEIGRALGKQPGSIHGVVAAGGGYAPATRRRSRRVLSLTEREEISRGLAEGLSLRTIARRLGRAPATVSREIARHGGRTHYRAAWAPIPYFMAGAGVAEVSYTPFGKKGTPLRLIVRRVPPSPGSQLALFSTFSYHAFICDRAGETLALKADHRRHAEIENAIRDLKYGWRWATCPRGRSPPTPPGWPSR